MPAKTKNPKHQKAGRQRVKSITRRGGQFVGADGLTKFERWNATGIKGFELWLGDVKPQILHSDGRYRPVILTPRQSSFIKKIYETDVVGNFKHSLALNIQPRRHGKSITYALVLLHLFCSRENFTIQLCGNTEGHSRRVQYNTLSKIIRNTPPIRALIPEKNITLSEISLPKQGNVIQAMSGANTAAAFGDRLNLIWVSDFHAAVSQDYFNALQAALLDSEGSLCLIDSNVDPVDGHVHQLQQEIESCDDPSMFCQHVFYKDFAEFEKKAPSWINRQKAARIFRTTLPSEARRDILSLRSDALNALFTNEIIQLCKSDYQIPVTDLKGLTNGRAYKVGAGLDRAKSIFGGMTGNDNTVLTVICKVAKPNGEPEIFVIDQQVIIPNTSRGVKKAILKAHQRYQLDNITLENYEVADLAPWLDDQKIPYELMSAHEVAQTISFTTFFQIAKEGRFFFPATLNGLESEMRTFSYKLKSNNKYNFGHAQQKFKDDRVYSANWAIFSLRQQILAPYVLKSIQCLNKSNRRNFCFLFGGDHILPGCSPQCFAFEEVEEMFKKFKAYQFDSEATIQEFYQTNVRLEGARIFQAA